LRHIKNLIFKLIFSELKKYKKREYYKNLDELKRSLKKSGNNFHLGKDYIFKNAKYIEIGDNFSAMERFRIEAWDNYNGKSLTPRIKIGDNVIFNTDIHIGCINEVVIKDNCLFASRIFITDHHHGNTEFKMTKISPKDRPLISKGPVVINKNVWVGEGVAIMPGVTIGENCIIATNTVVTKSTPPNTVVAGIPGKIIKKINPN
jgi:acetyltransferase-like isoleucine patch superfamily enzyme